MTSCSSNSMSTSFLLLFCITLILSPSDTRASSFACTSSTSPCTSIVAYVSPNATTLGTIANRFNLTYFPSILGPNKLPPSTPRTHSVLAKETINIPFNCSCTNGTGYPTIPPIYTIVQGDGLYNISTQLFSGLFSVQKIQEFNGIPDANKIIEGHPLKIPLPCSCDDVAGQRVVHLAYVVPLGDSVEVITNKFNVSETTLLQRNNLTAPADLKAEAVLDVPLTGCSKIARAVDTNLTCRASTTPPGAAAPSPSSAEKLHGRRRWNVELLLLYMALLCLSASLL